MAACCLAANLNSLRAVRRPCPSSTRQPASPNRTLAPRQHGCASIRRSGNSQFRGGRCSSSEKNVDVVEVGGDEENCSIDSFEVDVSIGGTSKTLTFGEVCDEFKCTSSPAVGLSVRRLAREMVEGYEGQRSLANFAEGVEYKDAYRSFKGIDKYEAFKFNGENVENQRGNLLDLQMAGKDTVVAKWEMFGTNKLGKLHLVFTEKLAFNLISGRVVKHDVTWEQGEQADGPAVAFYNVSRMNYSMGQNTNDALANAGDMLMGSDEEEGEVSPDMTDPTKFFQQQGQENDDLIQYALLLAILYALFQGLKAVL